MIRMGGTIPQSIAADPEFPNRPRVVLIHIVEAMIHDRFKCESIGEEAVRISVPDGA